MKTLILVNSKDLVSLANSVHAVTLLELNVTLNSITSGSAAGGLITLCHNLTNIKEFCSFKTYKVLNEQNLKPKNGVCIYWTHYPQIQFQVSWML